MEHQKLIDPLLIDEMVSEFLEQKEQYDYLSNTIEQTYPLGMNIEVFKMDALKIAYNNASKDYEREHVTPYIYTHKEIFKIFKKNLIKDYSYIRLTVDEKEDYLLIKSIIECFINKPLFGLKDIIDLYERNESMFYVNSTVKQKKYYGESRDE